MKDYTGQYTGMSQAYDKGRQGYDDWVLNQLPKRTIVDMGAGTGKMTELLLQNPMAHVIAIEPNQDMCDVLREKLQDYISVGCLDVLMTRAEDTGLHPDTADMVVAAMSYHWFDADAFKNECRRILKRDGQLVLVYFGRVYEGSVANACIDLFQRTCPDYSGFDGGVTYAMKHAPYLFRNGVFQYAHEAKPQHYNITAWLERNFSSSYAPKPGTPTYEEFVQGLHNIFNTYAVDGIITQTHQYTVIKGQV